MKLPIQTSLSVAPELTVSLSQLKIVTNSGKRAHPCEEFVKNLVV